ncbi:hypothetical protein RIVM261_076040 [Rivularia sp. IAM M-261]|nr:hypothetical protein RIVM261_076040 [Rivularia sp. IAM M-261]
MLGDGRIMPIADVLEIIDIFQGRTAKQSPVPFFEAAGNGTESTGAKIDPTVLIVDDSITVRELLSLSFNKAGYRVEQARSFFKKHGRNYVQVYRVTSYSVI